MVHCVQIEIILTLKLIAYFSVALVSASVPRLEGKSSCDIHMTDFEVIGGKNTLFSNEEQCIHAPCILKTRETLCLDVAEAST